jgi:hypothetical protein
MALVLVKKTYISSTFIEVPSDIVAILSRRTFAVTPNNQQQSMTLLSS